MVSCNSHLKSMLDTNEHNQDMFISYYFHKFLKLFVSQIKKPSQYLLLAVNISSNELVLLNLLLVCRSSSRSSSRFKRFSLGCLIEGSSLIRKIKKISQNNNSLYHSLSLVATQYIIRLCFIKDLHES